MVWSYSSSYSMLTSRGAANTCGRERVCLRFWTGEIYSARSFEASSLGFQILKIALRQRASAQWHCGPSLATNSGGGKNPR